ncbi:universal stress protein [Streptomyces canus]|uniref:universal stress protein n=1 Tax=Streptomyces canus TaxID=58343 RepID=UPI0033A30F1C
MVGIDGSESSLESVGWAAAEAARHSLSLHLVHAAAGDHEPSDVISAGGRYVFALVLGSRELGNGGDMLLGAVSLAVAARADCPVVVVRGAAVHVNGRFGNIVDGVEEGEGSGTALQFALRGAQVRSCRLTAEDAWNPSCMALPSRPAPSWNALEAQRRTPSQVLDDALLGMTQRYRDARVSPQVFGCPARRALLDPGVGGPADRRRTQKNMGTRGCTWVSSITRHCITRRDPSLSFPGYDRRDRSLRGRTPSATGGRGRKPARQGPSALCPDPAAVRRREQVAGNGRRTVGGGS